MLPKGLFLDTWQVRLEFMGILLWGRLKDKFNTMIVFGEMEKLMGSFFWTQLKRLRVVKVKTTWWRG